MIESDVVLFAQPGRRVITKNVSFEESDHHGWPGQLHQAQYRSAQAEEPPPAIADDEHPNGVKESPIAKRSAIERMISRIGRLCL
jgi:hypothetical protein